VHLPTYQNTTASNLTYATYANIRFAQPPTGQLRFRKPVTPPPQEKQIQDGKYSLGTTDCLITVPSYYPFPGVNGTSWGHEDCLFLDVKVPEGVRVGDNVPVVHWLYGSGVRIRIFASVMATFLIHGYSTPSEAKRGPATLPVSFRKCPSPTRNSSP